MTLAHGAIHAFLAVALGAFGAHGLAQVLDEYGARIWQTAFTYQMAHALALVLLGLWEGQRGRALPWAHRAFGVGILLFSGSLYLLALTGAKWLGAITPFGGIGFLLGWALFARANLPRRP